MRVVYAALLCLAVLAAFSGRLELALALGGAKALLVGAQYMELRHADRRHALLFAATIVGLTTVLIALGRSA